MTTRNMNTSTTTTSSRLVAIWADVRNGQRRFGEINRPWVKASRHSS